MPKEIWKFPLTFAHEQMVIMPEASKVLTVQMQGNSPCIWALCDPTTTRTVRRVIEMFGTGHPVPYEPHRYIGTVQTPGALVFHFFEGVIR